MANILTNNINVPRIARNKRIYQGDQSGVNNVSENNSSALIDWAIVTPDLIEFNRSVKVDGDLTISNLAGQEGAIPYVDENGALGLLKFVISEIPTGTIDGVNTDFTLANIPIGSTEIVKKRGLVMVRDVDYTITDDVITFLQNQPTNYGGFTDTLTVDYQYIVYGVSGGTPVSNLDYTTMTREAGASATGYDIKIARQGTNCNCQGTFISASSTIGAYIASISNTILGGDITTDIYFSTLGYIAGTDNKGLKLRLIETGNVFYIVIDDAVDPTTIEYRFNFSFFLSSLL